MINSSRQEVLRALASRVRPERADRFLCELANSPERPGAAGSAERHQRAWERLFRRFHDLFPRHGNPEHERPHRQSWEPPYEDAQLEKWNPRTDAPGLVWERPDDPGILNLEDVPAKLRRAWILPNALSREVFLMSELAYYLCGPAMFAAAKRAHELEAEARDRAREGGATPEQAFLIAYEVWDGFLKKEMNTAQTAWAIAEVAVDEFALVLLRGMHVADLMRLCPNPTCPAPYFIAKRRSQKYCSDACSLPAQREFKKAWWREHGSDWRKLRLTGKVAGSRKLQRQSE